MHKQEFIRLIDDAAGSLGITVAHFSDNWAMRLSRAGMTKYIVGYTFPLNDATCCKIARNKNLCSEILTCNKIPHIPHRLLYSPTILLKRDISEGNISTVEQFISQYGFPIVVKRNNSSKGEGVFIADNRTELEGVSQKVFHSDNVLCLSPLRKALHEYRNVILNNDCVLSYEKIRPHIIGNGSSSVIDLLFEFYQSNKPSRNQANFFDNLFSNRLDDVPEAGEKVFLQWKHNAAAGTRYRTIQDRAIEEMAAKAAAAINATFVTVDIVHSPEYGLEVLEINASVVLNAFSCVSEECYQKARDVYQLALQQVFHVQSRNSQ